MIVLDAHEDIAYNALYLGRDYRRSAAETRQIEKQNAALALKVTGSTTLGVPEWLRGRVAVVVATIYIRSAETLFGEVFDDIPVYHNPEEAHAHASQQVDFYYRFADEEERVQLILNQSDLGAVLRTWDDGAAEEDHRTGFIISMEGADPIVEPAQVEEWHRRGVRAVGPAWSQTRYSGGTGAPGPLTKLGHELLEHMGALNMVLDLSHAAEEAYFQMLERYEGSIIASHSNPRRFCPTDRGLSDKMIEELAARDGVMGIVPFNKFLKPDWDRGDPKDAVSVSTVLDVIDHVCQVTGSARHVGLGSDFDGGVGYEYIPAEMDTVADLWSLGEGLEARGFAPADVEAVLSGNFLRVFRAALPSA